MGLESNCFLVKFSKLLMSIDPKWLNAQFPELSNILPLDVGGQKSVFTASHNTHGKNVLKIFHPSADAARALREIQAVAAILSPRVPRILDKGIASSPTGDVIWFLEEYVSGQTLRKKLQAGPLSDTEILRIGFHVLEALKEAEARRIVHRDIKPENIIVVADGSAFLLDFGLARHLDQVSLTPTAALGGIGTVGYAPPEQFRNLKADQDSRTDLFAVGVSLYECVEGVNPFRQGARDGGEILHRVETTLLPPISRQIGNSNEFTDLVLAMSRPKLSHRPASIVEAYDWIKVICDREGIV